MTDWYDKNQCHSLNADVHDKTLGRIYHISHRNDRFEKVDLRTKASAELVELQLHANDWYVRHARRLLQERGPDEEVHAGLREILENNPDVTRRLRALWALHATGGINEEQLIELSRNSPEESVRAWTVRLLADKKEPPSPAVLERFAAMAAKNDDSALVRLYLASVRQRMPAADRWEILENLAAHGDDAGDHNIPLMLWYALEPMAPENPDKALALALASGIPDLFPFTVRRTVAMGREGKPAAASLEQALPLARDSEQRQIIRDALAELEGE